MGPLTPAADLGPWGCLITYITYISHYANGCKNNYIVVSHFHIVVTFITIKRERPFLSAPVGGMYIAIRRKLS